MDLANLTRQAESSAISNGRNLNQWKCIKENKLCAAVRRGKRRGQG